jgi:hypothetical protein
MALTLITADNIDTTTNPTVNAITVSTNTVTVGTSAYFVANGNLGIGTSSPSGCLDVIGSGSSAQRNWAYIRGGNVGAQNPVAGFSGGMAFGTNFSSGNSETNLVWGQTVGSGQYLSISKWTGTTVTEQMRIDSSGNIGIGTTSPTNTSGYTTLQLNNATNGGMLRISNGTQTYWNYVNSGGAYLGTSSNHSLFIQTNNTTQVTIDTSGNIGIGTSSPGNRLHISGASNAVSGVSIQSTGASGRKYTIYSASTGGLYFANDTGGGDQMVLDASGNLLVGQTSYNAGKVTILTTGNAPISCAQAGTTGDMIYFRTSTNTLAGYIQCPSGTTTSYVSVSDYRLKEDVQPITTGLETIGALKPVTYKWINDKSQSEGFIAHELQTVIPHAVAGEKDAVNEDGSIKPQGIDPAKIVVHLVAAIQELSAKNAELEARLEALESATSS